MTFGRREFLRRSAVLAGTTAGAGAFGPALGPTLGNGPAAAVDVLGWGEVGAGPNVLELEVTSVAVNRVRDLALRGELTLNFYMSWRTTPPREWDAVASGLLGPVRLLELG